MSTTAGSRPRFDVIDVLRGLVIVIMVMDHAREYAGGVGVTDPMKLEATSPLLFWMRWLTHFCAPVFTLLAGVSAGMQGAGSVDKAPWSWHQVSRRLVPFPYPHLPLPPKTQVLYPGLRDYL